MARWGFNRITDVSESERARIKFHTVHSANIARSDDGSRVMQSNSRWGVVFSNRSISINERLCIRLSHISDSFSMHALQLGVTNVNPELLRNSDVLVGGSYPYRSSVFRHSYLDDQYAGEGTVVAFFVSSDGSMHYSINGANKGIFLSGVDTTRPFWVAIDLNGRVMSVKFERQLSSDGRGAVTLPETSSAVLAPEASPEQLVPNYVETALPMDIRIQTASSSMNLAQMTSSSGPRGTANPTVSSSVARGALSGQMTSSTTNQGLREYVISPAFLHARLQKLQEEMRDLLDDGQTAKSDDCLMCMDAPVDAVITDCRHMYMCYECAVKIKATGLRCPICRESHKGAIKSFKI